MKGLAKGTAAGLSVAGLTALCGAAGYALGAGVAPATSSRMFPWIVARATGIGAFLALTGITLSGLLFRFPVRAPARVQRETLLRLHVFLWPALGGLMAAHLGALLSDRYAGVPWRALAVPDGATYRPGAVTYGVVAFWLISVVMLTAGLAGRFVVRHRWALLHRLAYPAFALTWLHGVLAGSDTEALRWLYLLTGMANGGAAIAAAFRRPLGAGAKAGA